MRARAIPPPPAAPAPKPVPPSRPTDERAARAEAVLLPDVNGTALRRWWTIRTRLDGLFLAHLIDARAYDAACAFRAAHARVAGAPADPLTRLGQARVAHDPHAVMLDRMDATARLRRVRERLGARQFAVVVLVVVEDVSWAALARRLRCGQRAAKRTAAAVLGRLAEGWAAGPAQPGAKRDA